MSDHIRKYGTDTAAYLAYKAAVLSVGAFPIPAVEFAFPADVMRHIVLVVRSAQDRIDAAKAAHVTLAEPEHKSWWAWPWR